MSKSPAAKWQPLSAEQVNVVRSTANSLRPRLSDAIISGAIGLCLLFIFIQVASSFDLNGPGWRVLVCVVAFLLPFVIAYLYRRQERRTIADFCDLLGDAHVTSCWVETGDLGAAVVALKRTVPGVIPKRAYRITNFEESKLTEILLRSKAGGVAIAFDLPPLYGVATDAGVSAEWAPAS